MRDRRICFIFSVRKQQILRSAQDDTLGEEFFSSLLESAPVAQDFQVFTCSLFFILCVSNRQSFGGFVFPGAVQHFAHSRQQHVG